MTALKDDPMMCRDFEVPATICSIGVAEAPREACGVVLDCLGGAAIVVEMDNCSSTPETDWEVAGVDVVRALETAVEAAAFAGLRPLDESLEAPLVWHTHPGGHAGPSERDMDMRHSGLRYMVVSVPDGKAARY